MSKILFNPFRYIAGWEALGIGVLALLATSVFGYYSHIHFPDLISVKSHSGIFYHKILLESVINWLIPSILFYLAALLFSPSLVRAVDVFGTQALARIPCLFAALTGFSGILDKFGRFTMWKALNIGDPVSMSGGEMILAFTFLLFIMLSTVWMIALMYNAFKVSANLKGSKLVLLFIAVIILSVVLTGLLIHSFLGGPDLFAVPALGKS